MHDLRITRLQKKPQKTISRQDLLTWPVLPKGVSYMGRDPRFVGSPVQTPIARSNPSAPVPVPNQSSPPADHQTTRFKLSLVHQIDIVHRSKLYLLMIHRNG